MTKEMPMLKHLAVLTALALAACGGNADTAEFQANAPSYQDLSLQVSDADSATPAERPDDSVQQDEALATCHPHLFDRTHEVVARLNRHFFKLLHHVAAVIEDHPRLRDGQHHEWDHVRDGVERNFGMTRTVNGDG